VHKFYIAVSTPIWLSFPYCAADCCPLQTTDVHTYVVPVGVCVRLFVTDDQGQYIYQLCVGPEKDRFLSVIRTVTI
jgi:hypothetical protein